MKISHQKGKKVKDYLITFIIYKICYCTKVYPKETLSPSVISLSNLTTAASSDEGRLAVPRHASSYMCLFLLIPKRR